MEKIPSESIPLFLILSLPFQKATTPPPPTFSILPSLFGIFLLASVAMGFYIVLKLRSKSELSSFIPQYAQSPVQ